MINSPISIRMQSSCVPTIWQTVVALVQQTKGVNLSQGAPEFGPQPFFLENMKKATQKLILQPQYRRGTQELRQMVANYHQRQYGKLDANNNIAIVAGAGIGLFNLFQIFINPGDQILVFQPAFDYYIHHANILQAKIQSVKLINNHKKSRKQLKEIIQNGTFGDAQNWEVDWQAFKGKLNQKIKIIIINSPHNPTGKIFTQKEIDIICQMVLDYPGIVLLQDNVYEGFTFDEFKGERLPKIIHSKYYSQLKDRVVNVYSAGKLLEATGIRCGWVIGPEYIIRLMEKFHYNTAEEVSGFVQKAIALCLQDIIREDYYYLLLEATRAEHHRLQLLKVISQCCYDFKITIPKSGYFILVDISNIQIQEKYFTFRLKEGQLRNPRDLAFTYQMAFQKGVIVVPCSSFFGEQSKQQNYIRFAHCKTLESFEQAKLRLTE